MKKAFLAWYELSSGSVLMYSSGIIVWSMEDTIKDQCDVSHHVRRHDEALMDYRRGHYELP